VTRSQTVPVAFSAPAATHTHTTYTINSKLQCYTQQSFRFIL